MSSKNVTIKVNGEVLTFANTSKVALQVAGSAEVARYTEISDTTATAADVKKNKVFYNYLGTRTIGTHVCSGGSDEPNGWAIETESAEEMADAKTRSNIGRIYKWVKEPGTGPDPYTYGAYYMVYDDSEEVY